jgi:acyl-CoA thioesterase FadM
MLKNRKTIHIERGDCDPTGIIFASRYFVYFDACTHTLLERAAKVCCTLTIRFS